MIFVIRVPSKPSLVFSSRKPFYSQPKYSCFLVLILSALINHVPGCIEKPRFGYSWREELGWVTHPRWRTRWTDAVRYYISALISGIRRLYTNEMSWSHQLRRRLCSSFLCCSCMNRAATFPKVCSLEVTIDRYKAVYTRPINTNQSITLLVRSLEERLILTPLR